MISLLEIKSYLNVDYDDKDWQLESLIEESESTIFVSTGVDIEKVKNLADNILTSLYKTVQKMLIREEYEEKSSDSKALIAKYTKLELYYKAVNK